MSEDMKEAEILESMASEAKAYISGFRWSKPIEKQDMLFGVGDVLALFLFTFSAPIGGADKKLWVVVGDLPTAYLVVVEDDSPRGAIERYCELMLDWCDVVERKGDLDEVFPVKAAPTPEHAAMLRGRVDTINAVVLPEASTELVQP